MLVLSLASRGLGAQELDSGFLVPRWSREGSTAAAYLACALPGCDALRLDAWSRSTSWDHGSLTAVRFDPSFLELGLAYASAPDGMDAAKWSAATGLGIWAGLRLPLGDYSAGLYGAFAPSLALSSTLPDIAEKVDWRAEAQGLVLSLSGRDCRLVLAGEGLSGELSCLGKAAGEFEARALCAAASYKGIGAFFLQLDGSAEVSKSILNSWMFFADGSGLARGSGGWIDVSLGWREFELGLFSAIGLFWFDEPSLRTYAQWPELATLSTQKEEMAYRLGKGPAWAALERLSLAWRPAKGLRLLASRWLPLGGGWELATEIVSSTRAPAGGHSSSLIPEYYSLDWEAILLEGAEFALSYDF
jgi:hypothetical protein